jgi:hypothetical protein
MEIGGFAFRIAGSIEHWASWIGLRPTTAGEKVHRYNFR